MKDKPHYTPNFIIERVTKITTRMPRYRTPPQEEYTEAERRIQELKNDDTNP